MTLGRPHVIVVPIPKTSKETQTGLNWGEKNLSLGGIEMSDWKRSGADYVQIAFYEILKELIILLK